MEVPNPIGICKGELGLSRFALNQNIESQHPHIQLSSFQAEIPWGSKDSKKKKGGVVICRVCVNFVEDVQI